MRAEVAERARSRLLGLEAPRGEGRVVAPVLEVAAAEVTDLAELARLDQLAGQPHRRHEAVVEAAEVLDACRRHALPDLVALVRVAAERLLAEDVLARLGSRDRRRCVQGIGAAVVEQADRRVGDDVLPVGRPAFVAELGGDCRDRVLVPPGHRDEPRLQRRVEVGDLLERARVGLAHEGVAEHADADLARHSRGVVCHGDAGAGADDRADGAGRGAGGPLRVRCGRARRAGRRRHDGRRRPRHAAERAAEGVHGGAQRRGLDPRARGEGRRRAGRARELRSVLHVLPRRRRRVRAGAARRRGRRQRAAGRGRRRDRAAGARPPRDWTRDEAGAPLHRQDQQRAAQGPASGGRNRRGGEPRRRPRAGVRERARDRALPRQLRGASRRRRDRCRLHLAPERHAPRMDAEGDRGRQARPRREALLAPVRRGRGGVGRGRSRGRHRDGGLHVASPSAGCCRALARRGRRDRAAPGHPHDLQLPVARPRATSGCWPIWTAAR